MVTAAVALVTVSMNEAGAETVKFGSGLYVAKMASVGATNPDAMQVAAPAPPFTERPEQVGIEVPLAVKLTVPLGLTGLSRTPVREAKKVTGVPTGTDGVKVDTVKVGVRGLTVWGKFGAVEPT